MSDDLRQRYERRAYSALAGRVVGTWPSEWQRQCEVDYLLSLSLNQRMRIIDGVPGQAGGDRDSRPMASIRGQAAVDVRKADLDRMERLLTMPRQ
jgi:hypothetical protein